VLSTNHGSGQSDKLRHDAWSVEYLSGVQSTFSVASMELIGRVRARQRPKEQPKTATRRLEWCYVVTSDDG
jgi:hypothetical protein